MTVLTFDNINNKGLFKVKINYEILQYNRDRSDAKISSPHLNKTMFFALLMTGITEYLFNTMFYSLSVFALFILVYYLFRNLHHFITRRISNELTNDLFSKDLRLNNLIYYIKDKSNDETFNDKPLFSWEELIFFRGILSVIISKNDTDTLIKVCDKVFKNNKLFNEWFYKIILPYTKYHIDKIDNSNIDRYARFALLVILTLFVILGVYDKVEVMKSIEQYSIYSKDKENSLLSLLMTILYLTPQSLIDDIIESN